MEKIKLGARVPAMALPICLLGATVNGRSNFCPIAWTTIIDNEPPLIGLVTAKDRYTKEGVQQHQTFSINIPNSKLAAAVDYCGLHSGYDTDKSQVFTTFSGELATAPMIKNCPLTAECRLQQIVEFAGTDLIVGEIVETYVNEELVSEGKVNAEQMDPLLYFTNGSIYHRLGAQEAKAFKIGKEYRVHD